MNTFLIALGLVAVIEGLVIALAPNYYEKIIDMLAQMSHEQRRILGLLIAVMGLIIIWLVRL